MQEKPQVIIEKDGSRLWETSFSDFEVRVYVPRTGQIAEIVNFGFRAPYLIVFDESDRNLSEIKKYADGNGLAQIASEYYGSVVFIYPTNEGGWKCAPSNLYEQLIANSRISQYYENGMAIMRDRFTGKWGETFIRGAVFRTYLYGCGESADYIASHCLKKVAGVGLYGPGEITPAACILEKLSVIPKPEKRDIAVVSIGNDDEINEALCDGLDYVRVEDRVDTVADYHQFIGTFRRMMGNPEREADLSAIGMVMEPDFYEVKTSEDNYGDDQGTERHHVGYVAYYNFTIISENKPVPLVLCFHGGGDSAMCMTSVSGWYRVAHDHNFILVSIENHLNSTATEMIELLEMLKQKYPVDTEKIYATGFSMGGCKSWDIFQEYPLYFAGVAPMDATFEVGLNSYGKIAPSAINRNVLLPVFYVGGAITPLPELPFQEVKCLNRMAYVLEVNHSIRKNHAAFDRQEEWENPIWGLNGEHRISRYDAVRDAILTLELFDSEDGICYSVFGSVNNQQHEVRYHSCESAWEFLSSFKRTDEGKIQGQWRPIEIFSKK